VNQISPVSIGPRLPLGAVPTDDLLTICELSAAEAALYAFHLRRLSLMDGDDIIAARYSRKLPRALGKIRDALLELDAALLEDGE